MVQSATSVRFGHYWGLSVPLTSSELADAKERLAKDEDGADRIELITLPEEPDAVIGFACRDGGDADEKVEKWVADTGLVEFWSEKLSLWDFAERVPLDYSLFRALMPPKKRATLDRQAELKERVAAYLRRFGLQGVQEAPQEELRLACFA